VNHALSITDTPDAPTVPAETVPDGAAHQEPAPEDGVDLDGAQVQPEAEAPAAEAEPEAPTAEAETPQAEAPEAPEADASSPDGEPAAEAEAPAAEAAKPKRSRTPRERQPSGGPGGRDRRTTAQRLGNFPRADRPADIPAPDHHHLPGWVRRDFARARPPLSNILALLEGDVRDQYAAKIEELTTGISAGRFSLAWQYPDLVDEGRALYEKQRREGAESARANRQLDTARRRVADRIRDAADQLGADVAARLQRQLRSANDPEAINAVAGELDGVATAAKTTAEKRREREIERTRARIQRSAAVAGAAEAPPQTETWQDVLRRFAEQQAAGSVSGE
jgi:hypothetical protein